MIYWILWVLLAPWVALFFPTKVIGKKYYKATKGKKTILASNHQSLADPILLKVRVNPNFKLMAKNSLFNNKLFGSLLRKMGAYPVNRGGNDIEAVKTTLGHLKKNKHVVIFPEGTRIDDGDMEALKDGVATFAMKTDSYVVPAIFKKKPRFLSPNSILIGKPFKFSDYEEFKGVKITKELIQKGSQILAEKLKFLKEISPKEYKKMIKQDLKNSNKELNSAI